MGGTGYGKNWVGKAMLSKSLSSFLLMGKAVFPPCSLAVGVMVTSFKRTYAEAPRTVVFSAPDPMAAHY